MLKDEVFQITISADEYQAHLSTKPGATDPQLNEAKLKYILKNNNVVYGLKDDVLKQVVQDCQAGNPVDNVLVAEGVQPQEGTMAKVELKFEITSKPKEDASGKIDYREIGKIIPVAAEQVLAVKNKMIPPVNGLTVTGKPFSFPKIEDIPLISGANIYKEEVGNTILFKAKINGALNFDRNVLSISPILEIPRDVDFAVGNIHFNGDVKIGRDVLPGFIVEASGKVQIWGSAISAKVSAADEIDIRAGIIGKNHGEVTSGKSIQAGFVENAKLKAENDIIVKYGIIGSQVHCGGFFQTVTKSSKIVETSLLASKGITTFVAGSKYSIHTQLITGIVPEKELEFLKVKTLFEQRLQETRELERRYGRAMLENRNNIPRGILERALKDIDRWDQLKEELLEINNQMKLIEDVMYDYKATIVIKELLFPKVLLKIGKFEAVSSHEKRNVVVRYSEKENELVF